MNILQSTEDIVRASLIIINTDSKEPNKQNTLNEAHSLIIYEDEHSYNGGHWVFAQLSTSFLGCVYYQLCFMEQMKEVCEVRFSNTGQILHFLLTPSISYQRSNLNLKFYMTLLNQLANIQWQFKN